MLEFFSPEQGRWDFQLGIWAELDPPCALLVVLLYLEYFHCFAKIQLNIIGGWLSR